MTTWSWLRLTAIVAGVTIFDMVTRNVPGLTSVVNFSLVTVIALTLFSGWRQGIVAALIAGSLHRLFSAFPSAFPIASLGLTVLIIAVLFQRVMTARATLSLVTLTALGTVVYYGTLGAMLRLAVVIDTNSIVPIWSSWWWAMGIQMIFHPLLILSIRWLRGGGQYHTVSTDRPF